MITKIAKITNLNSGLNTVKVEVETKFRHLKYDKLIKSHKSYLVHLSEENKSKYVQGDTVKILQVKPYSRKKFWKILNKI